MKKTIIMCFVMVLGFVFLSGNVFAEESFCDSYQTLAEKIMRAHQYGVPEKEVIDAIIESDVNGIPQMIDLTHLIYKTPVMNTEKSKENAIKQVGTDVYYECVKAVYEHGAAINGPKS